MMAPRRITVPAFRMYIQTRSQVKVSTSRAEGNRYWGISMMKGATSPRRRVLRSSLAVSTATRIPRT